MTSNGWSHSAGGMLARGDDEWEASEVTKDGDGAAIVEIKWSGVVTEDGVPSSCLDL